MKERMHNSRTERQKVWHELIIGLNTAVSISDIP